MLRTYPSNSVHANVVFRPNKQLSIKLGLLQIAWNRLDSTESVIPCPAAGVADGATDNTELYHIFLWRSPQASCIGFDPSSASTSCIRPTSPTMEGILLGQ